MKIGLPFLAVAILLGAGCRAAAPSHADSAAAPPYMSPWSPDFDPPTALDTERVHLEPLAPRHAELDFAALMGSREHLQRTLQWGGWPRAGFTLEENAEDLDRHWREFERREAYAYTVLTPNRSRCLGCVYVYPTDADAPPAGQRDALVFYWVIEEQLASRLDRHLVTSLLEWFGAHWPFDWIYFLPHVANVRGAAWLTELGLAEIDSPTDEHRMFAWKPDDRSE